MMPFDAIKTTTANRIVGADIVVRAGMDEYSGWGWVDHLKWICELTGLNLSALIILVGRGYLVMTDESASKVWLVSRDYYKSTARLIYEDCADDSC